jgi:hypothetical protein
MLVRRKLEMVRGEGPTEVGKRPVTLVKHGTEPHAGGVAVDDVRTREVLHLENGAHREGPLQGLERGGGLIIPGEGVVA